MTAYRDWVADVKALGGVATAWPFNDANYGQLAARFDINTYVDVFNAGALPTGAGTRTTANNQYAYVLATAMTQNDAADRSALDLVLPTSAEEAAAQKRLLVQWGLPPELPQFGDWMEKGIVTVAGAVAVAWLVGQFLRGRGSRA